MVPSFFHWLYLLEHENPIFTPNQNSLIIGIQHEVPINLKPEIMSLITNLAKLGIYFEGNHPENVVKNFISKYLPHANLKSWEPPETTIPEICSMAISLFGGDTNEFMRKVRPEPKMTIIELLEKQASQWHHRPNLKLIREIVKIANLEKEANLPATNINLSRFHERGFDLMYDQWSCFSNNNSLQALQLEANTIRNKHLLRIINKGGIFFVGFSHINCIKEILNGHVH